MLIEFNEIVSAFNYVSSGQMDDHQAFLDKETGKVYWHSEFGDNFEELPDDIGDERYLEIPHKNELDMGRNLVMKFAYQRLDTKDVEKVESFFKKKGAYSRFKSFLEQRGILDSWHEYEAKAEENVLKQWCEENNLEIHG